MALIGGGSGELRTGLRSSGSRRTRARGGGKGLAVGGQVFRSLSSRQCGPARAWQEGIFQPINMIRLDTGKAKKEKNQRLCKC